MGPCDLREILAKLPEDRIPALLSSIRSGEDAGVYLLSEDMALVQTVDFFPPIVDDPRSYGQVAAANALSDIYAMGATPLTAMNIVAFPLELCGEVLEQVLLGGHDKAREAGAVVIGGHTIEDDEPKYGMAVTGVARPGELMTISAAAPGDSLVLTKPLGTGIIATAVKAGMAPRESSDASLDSMRRLNKAASEALRARGVRACTDVTGFGLLGHLSELLAASGVSADVVYADVPLLTGALDLAGSGMIPQGTASNREGVLVDASGVGAELLDCLFDPQTSGGLLACVREDSSEELLADLRRSCPGVSVIGSITAGDPGKIRLLH